MSTHAIGPGKKIEGVPMPVEWSRQLGRLSCVRDKSKAEIVRELVIRELRRARRAGEIGCVAVFASVVSLHAVLGSGWGGDEGDDLRNVRRVRRSRRREDFLSGIGGESTS